MANKKIIFKQIIVIYIFALILTSCTKITNLVKPQVLSNSKTSLKAPYLLLISLDGFRWDYVEKYKPPHLSQFIKNGIKAESLIPSFPSKTFPNHYTIATGLYPDKHGILGNLFYDYKKGLKYSIKKHETVEDGGFYQGTPIWVQAAKAGMVSASFFFIGSEAKIKGKRPSYYYNFDNGTTKETRVSQALKWLALPIKERPHLITMYFSDMDNTGHWFGPNDDKEIKRALFELDSALGNLFKGIEETKLPVNIIIVSDHGMMEIPIENYIPFESIKNDEYYFAINNGAIINIHPKHNDQINTVFNFLKDKEKGNNFRVYKTKDTPGFEYVPQNKNWGALQIIPNNGYYFSTSTKIDSKRESNRPVFGQHGFDPIHKDMHGIFYANGPAFKQEYIVPSFKNIHIYPIMCKILGLDIPNNIDGKLAQLNNILVGNE